MATSQNGWPVLQPTSTKLHRWVIPARNGHFTMTLRNGSAGFLLAHFFLWLSEVVEDITDGIVDDWGYALRAIRGQLTGWSNHSSGCAGDTNSIKHPLGKRATWRRWQYIKLRARLTLYSGCIRMGIDYVNRPDEMHSEINAPLDKVERVARRLTKTKRGQRILAANPGQRKVIFS